MQSKKKVFYILASVLDVLRTLNQQSCAQKSFSVPCVQISESSHVSNKKKKNY